MEIAVHLPDDLAQHTDPGREALDALAIEGFRSGALSRFEAAQLLGLGRLEFDGFLHARQIFDHAYDEEDFAQDIETLRKLRAKDSSSA